MIQRKECYIAPILYWLVCYTSCLLCVFRLWCNGAIDATQMAEGQWSFKETSLGICDSDEEDGNAQSSHGHLSIRKQTSYR